MMLSSIKQALVRRTSSSLTTASSSSSSSSSCRRAISNRAKSSVLTDGFQPTAISNKGVYLGSTFFELPPRTLPQLDASVLLEPREFCRNTALASGPTSISGGEAAKRLLEGRKVLNKVMREELGDCREITEKSYILKGHGVPIQLLQHHIDSSLLWIDRLSPNDAGATLRLEAEVGYPSAECVTIYSSANKDWGSIQTTKKWPAMWQYDLDLYVAVVKRIAEKLSSVLPFRDEFGITQQECNPTLKCWNIVVHRKQDMPPSLIPPDIGIAPVVQCLPMSPIEGRIRIKLQGKASGTDEMMSLSFDAVFDTRS